jgi:aminopeptidase C
MRPWWFSARNGSWGADAVVRRHRYVYQVVIPKKLAPAKYVEILEAGNPAKLPVWDPMGSLA